MMRTAGVDGVFVELQPFVGHAAKNHGAEPAVADRQCLDPLVGRAGVPEGQCARLLVGPGRWSVDRQLSDRQR